MESQPATGTAGQILNRLLQIQRFFVSFAPLLSRQIYAQAGGLPRGLREAVLLPQQGLVPFQELFPKLPKSLTRDLGLRPDIFRPYLPADA